MTVENEISKVAYDADGVQTEFAYTFRLDATSDMQVFFDEVEQVGGFTVFLANDVGGPRVVFAPDPPPAMTSVTLLRFLPLDQQADYVPFDKFPAESHEQALDKLTMLVQQLQEELSRTTKFGQGSDPTVDYTLPNYDAGKGWMWSEDDPKRIVNSDDTLNGILVLVTAQADAAAASASAAATSAAAASASESAASASEAAALGSESAAAISAAEAAATAAKVKFWDISWSLDGSPQVTQATRILIARPLRWIFNTPAFGYVRVAPASQVVARIARYDAAGVLIEDIGTLTWAAAANVATWAATAVANIDFVAGEQVAMVTPADISGITDIVVTIPLEIL